MKLVTTMITGLKDQERTRRLVELTTVGISFEKESMKWTAEDYENICDNINQQEVESRGRANHKVGRAGVHVQTRSLEGSSG